jgi:integrase/recombinase XerC
MTEISTAWTTALDDFTAWMRAAGRAPGTIRLRRLQLLDLAREYADPWTVTGDALTRWLSNADWKAETRKSHRAAARTFYDWAVRTDRLSTSPADILDPVKIPRALPRPASRAALDAALQRADDQGRLMLMLGAYAGLRCMEIAAVRPHTDIADSILTVRGKGGRDRRVPLHPLLAAEIGRELDRRRAGTTGTGFRYRGDATPEGYLFPGQSGGHITTGPVVKRLSRLLGESLTAHQLRHRFASQAYAVDRDLRAVQELLGHSKPDTTARYTAVPSGALLAAVLGVDRDSQQDTSSKPSSRQQLASVTRLPSASRPECPEWCDYHEDSGDASVWLHTRQVLDQDGIRVELSQTTAWEAGEIITEAPLLLLTGTGEGSLIILPATLALVSAFAQGFADFADDIREAL